LARWAQVPLGRQWSGQLKPTEGHKLITRGPCSWIRHPIYAALVSPSIGFGLVTANCLFILSGELSVGVALDRIPREERMMREGGPGYADYPAKVPFRLCLASGSAPPSRPTTR